MNLRAGKWFPRLYLQIFVLILGGFVSFAYGANKSNSASSVKEPRLSVKPLDLSKPPSIEDLMAAGQLGGRLYPTQGFASKLSPTPSNPPGSSSSGLANASWIQDINLSFGEAIQSWNKHDYKNAVKQFQKHLKDFPNSPWTEEADLHVACEARYNGRYVEAQNRFQGILDRMEGNPDVGAQKMKIKAQYRLAALKILENDFDGAQETFGKVLKDKNSDWRMRTYASSKIQKVARMKADKLAVLTCGVQALSYLLEKQGKMEQAREVLTKRPTTENGHSMTDLKGIAAGYGYALVGLKLTLDQLQGVPLPAIVQISRFQGAGHYWVLEKVTKTHLKLYDPQSRQRFEQTPEQFDLEWHGNALVFAQKESALPGTPLEQQEQDRIFGGCCGLERPDDDLGPPGDGAFPPDRSSPPTPLGPLGSPNSPGPQNPPGPPNFPDGPGKCYGSPGWVVNPLNLNFFMSDIPLWYTPAIGPAVEITVNYNSQSALAFSEPFGNKWQFNYGGYLVIDPGGEVTVFMPTGKRDVFTPDGLGGYIAPYQVFNELVQITPTHFELRFPEGTVYVYDIPAGTSSLQPYMVAIRDAYGNSLSFGYDTNVQLTTVTDAVGQQTTLTYDANGLVTLVSDPFGRTAIFAYDGNRNLTQITDMGGITTSFTYDSDIYLTSVQNANGTWNIYIEPSSPAGNISPVPVPPGGEMWENYRITITNPLGEKEEYYYNGYNRNSWYVSPRDYIDYKSFNENNYSSNAPKTQYTNAIVSGQTRKLGTTQFPEGGIETHSYDGVGNRTTVTDTHGHATTRSFNLLGRVTSITEPGSNVFTLTYDPANNIDLLRVEDARGPVVITYNPQHDVTSITDALLQTTSTTYNAFGQVSTITDAMNVVTAYIYEPITHRLQQVKKDGLVVESFTYDSVGRVRTRTDATGLTLTFDYDNLNRLTTTTYPDLKTEVNTWATCCPSQLTSRTDRGGKTTRLIYDAMGRLTQLENLEKGQLKFSYDANGNMTRLIDSEGNKTEFRYDLNNRLVGKTFADGTMVTFNYDNEGLLASKVNARGITTTYTYDSNHNLTGINYSDGTPSVSYVYDIFNQMTQRTDATGVTNFTLYDANSQLKNATGPWETLAYSYDAMGRVTNLVPAGGQTVVYSYDNQGRMDGVTVGGNTYGYTYTGANPLVQILSRPNTSTTQYLYDSLNRLTEVSNKDSASSIINQFAYTYNAQDMRDSETITNGNPITTFQQTLDSFTHNEVNQLLTSTNPVRTFTYDLDGNTTQGYTAEGYTFTATYDAENRLSTLEYTDNGSVVHKREYSYRGDGFLGLTKNFENGAPVKETRFVRDGLLALQERDGSNALVRELGWGLNLGGGIGGLLNLEQGGQDYSYLYDGKGNVSALLDASQQIVAVYTYDVDGVLKNQVGTTSQPYQFSTKRYDEGTGLSNFGYRFYCSNTARWLSRDPIEERGGLNLYAFVEGNPVHFIDPDGLTSITNGVATDTAVTLINSYNQQQISQEISKENPELDPVLISMISGAILGGIDGAILGCVSTAVAGCFPGALVGGALGVIYGSSWEAFKEAMGINRTLGGIGREIGNRMSAPYDYSKRQCLQRLPK